MRCPDCNKFVSMEMQDPDDVELTIDYEGGPTIKVSVTAHIVRTCAECGTELKEGSVEAEQDFELDATKLEVQKFFEIKDGKVIGFKGEVEMEIEEDGVDQLEEGGGRYSKSYFGAEVNFEIKAHREDTKDEELVLVDSIQAKVAAGDMEEMV